MLRRDVMYMHLNGKLQITRNHYKTDDFSEFIIWNNFCETFNKKVKD